MPQNQPQPQKYAIPNHIVHQIDQKHEQNLHDFDGKLMIALTALMVPVLLLLLGIHYA